jgi:Cu(I)/Ag(I) efflux system membrane protein CusA/SilA
VPGVAEVAAVGGFAKQCQVNVDPTRLRAYNVPLTGHRRGPQSNKRSAAA